MPRTFHAVDPTTGQPLQPEFRDATAGEVDAAVRGAASAFASYRAKAADAVAAFLERIRMEIEGLGDGLVERARAETGLPVARLQNERERTLNGVRLFTDLVREGSWITARIDRGDPGRTPAPKPDLRLVR